MNYQKLSNYIKNFFLKIKHWYPPNRKLIVKVVATTFFIFTLILVVYFIGKTTFFKGKAAENTTARDSATSLEDQIKNDTEGILTPGKADAQNFSKTAVGGQGFKANGTNNAVALSLTRKKLMEDLLQKDPKAFLQLAIPAKVSKALPKEVQDNLEQEVSYQGVIQNLHFDDFKNKTSTSEFYLSHDGVKNQIYFADGGPESILSGSKVSVNGFALSGKIAVASSQDLPKNPAFTLLGPPHLPGLTTRRIAVVLFNFQDNPIKPWTFDQVKDLTFNSSDSVNTYYKTVSNNKLSLTGDVFDWLTVPVNQNGCNYWEGSDAAKNILARKGVSLDSYDNVIYAFPGLPCWFGGLAEIGGKNSWINGIYDYSVFNPSSIKRTGVVAHEFGHNLGLLHANSYVCHDASGHEDSIDVPPNCQSMEYGDPFDVMGWNTYEDRHLNNFHLGQLGWLSDGNTKVTNISGEYLIYPLERNLPNKTQALKIPFGYDLRGRQLFYYLEYRRPTGLFDNFSNSDQVVNGISIRVGNSYTESFTNPLLIDPIMNDNNPNSSLLVGKTFNDTFRGIKIKTLEVADKFAKISLIKTKPPCIRSKPNVEMYPIAEWGTPGEGLNYYVAITNQDSLGCGSSQFSLSPTLFSGWTQENVGTSLPVIIAPYQTTYISFVVRSSSSTPAGYYSFTEKITHSGGQAYSNSIMSNYNVYYSDTTPPTVKFINPKDGDVVTGYGNIQIEANDDTQVSFLVLYDNDQYLCGWNIGPFNCYYDSSKLSFGNHVLRADAYDILNNLGTASININYKSPSPSPTATPIFLTSPPSPTATTSPTATPSSSPPTPTPKG